jgi:hypothetical protein
MAIPGTHWHAVERAPEHCTQYIAPTYAGKDRKRTLYISHNALDRVPSRARYDRPRLGAITEAELTEARDWLAGRTKAVS